MFRTTIKATNYGLLASKKDRNRLAALRNVFIGQTKKALDREQWNLASVFATQAQFCREALEAEILDRQVSEIFREARI
ncbi:MAG: hypothetical protein SRB2_04890 [Desulfobacteraceae bacterium Eth-SRB2]|nr:MAG: hypothetical protein SRB2_04890 [Desulfobacteraceae bacterium Eth-SRB2]